MNTLRFTLFSFLLQKSADFFLFLQGRVQNTEPCQQPENGFKFDIYSF